MRSAGERILALLCAVFLLWWVYELATPGLSWGYRLPAEAFLPVGMAVCLFFLRDLRRQESGLGATETTGELGTDHREIGAHARPGSRAGKSRRRDSHR